MDEKRNNLINAAIDKLSELTGEDFHGYRSEVWNVLSLLLSEKEKEICTLEQSINSYIDGIQVSLKERRELKAILLEKEKEIAELRAILQDQPR